jgi:predicted transcriptional regulator
MSDATNGFRNRRQSLGIGIRDMATGVGIDAGLLSGLEDGSRDEYTLRFVERYDRCLKLLEALSEMELETARRRARTGHTFS